MAYPEGESKSTPVKITKGLDEAINMFLETERAHLLGFRYKIDVVNAAVRDLLIKYGFPEVLETAEEHPE